MKYEVKMEWIFTFTILLIVSSIFHMSSDAEVQQAAGTAIITALSTAMGYLFGKSKPDA